MRIPQRRKMEKDNSLAWCLVGALTFMIINCYFYDRHESKMKQIVIKGFDLNIQTSKIETQFNEILGDLSRK